MTWALVTAKFVDIVTNTDPDQHEFKQNLDDLNAFMDLHHVSSQNVNGLPSLRRRLREYLLQTEHMRRMSARTRVQSLLSPELQAEVALDINSHWFKRITFFRHADHGFLVRVSLSLSARVFPPSELIAPTCIYVMSAGIALVARRLVMRGHVFGLDSLLLSNFLPRFSARAITYVDVSMHPPGPHGEPLM